MAHRLHAEGPGNSFHAADRTSLIPEVRRIIAAADPEQPISNVRTMEEIVAGETESRTIQMRVLIIFTGVAILLAGLGIYGLLSFTVSLRQQEFGIRDRAGRGPWRHLQDGTATRREVGGRWIVAGAGARLFCSATAGELVGWSKAGRWADVHGRSGAVPRDHDAGNAGSCAARHARRSDGSDAGGVTAGAGRDLRL